MKKQPFIVVGAIAIVALAVWKFWPDQSQPSTPAAMGGVPVAVATITKQDIEATYTLPGRVNSEKQAFIRPQVDGVIEKRFFTEGSHVNKGDQLYQIDSRRYDAALQSAQAALQSAQANATSVQARAKRYDDLIEIEAISQQEYDDLQAQLQQAEADIAVAQAAVTSAQVNVDYTKVYAPISGRIDQSLVTEGALVTANQSEPLAVVSQLDPVYIDMQLSATEVAPLRSKFLNKKNEKTSATVTLVMPENYAQEGELKFSGVAVDPTTDAVTLRATMPNPDGILLPGLFVRGEVKFAQKDVLLVPQRATMLQPDGSLMAWVVDENKTAQPRPLKANEAYQDQWIVTDGLTEGDTVIVEGYLKVKAGAPVSPTPWQAEETVKVEQPENQEKAAH